MKFSKIILVVGVVALGFISCKKDDPGINMTGTWEGNWGFDTDVPSNPEKWVLDKNGDMTAYYNGEAYAAGTWEADGQVFKAQYTPVGATYSYSFKGYYHDSPETIEGDWGQSPSSTDGGTFVMLRD